MKDVEVVDQIPESFGQTASIEGEAISFGPVFCGGSPFNQKKGSPMNAKIIKHPSMSLSLSEAISVIDSDRQRKHELLLAYIEIGKFISIMSKKFTSTKLFGQHLKKELPASQRLDASTRSDSKWLYEALYDPQHAAYGLLLPALGVASLDQVGVTHPSTIRRRYRKWRRLQLLKVSDAA